MLKQIINNCNRIRNRLTPEDAAAAAAAAAAAREACISAANGRITAAQAKIDAAQAKIDDYTAKKEELEEKRQIAIGLANLGYQAYTQVSTCVPGMGINNQNSLVDDVKCMANFAEGAKKAIKECDDNIEKYEKDKEKAEKEKSSAEAAKRSC